MLVLCLGYTYTFFLGNANSVFEAFFKDFKWKIFMKIHVFNTLKIIMLVFFLYKLLYLIPLKRYFKGKPTIKHTHSS